MASVEHAVGKDGCTRENRQRCRGNASVCEVYMHNRVVVSRKKKNDTNPKPTLSLG